MRGRHASRTALAAAYLRAAHQFIDTGPRILDDPVALPLLGQDAAQQIRMATDRYMARELTPEMAICYFDERTSALPMPERISIVSAIV